MEEGGGGGVEVAEEGGQLHHLRELLLQHHLVEGVVEHEGVEGGVLAQWEQLRNRCTGTQWSRSSSSMVL